jgi:hypothetical protein
MMWISFFAVLALSSAFFPATIHENGTHFEKLNMQFDFIVVGGTVLLHWLPPQKLTVRGGV